jgi:uncharacterized membrane protein
MRQPPPIATKRRVTQTAMPRRFEPIDVAVSVFRRESWSVLSASTLLRVDAAGLWEGFSMDTHGHHRGGGRPVVEVRTGARIALLSALVVAGLAVVVGLFTLWPERSPHKATGSFAFAAPGVSFPHASVLRVHPACVTTSGGDEGGSGPSGGEQGAVPPGCGQVTARLLNGSHAGKVVTFPVAPDVSRSGLTRGDHVELVQTPPGRGAPVTFSFFTVDRLTPIWVLLGLFVVVVGLVARLRGLLAIVGLGFAALVIVKFMLPALLAGESGLGVALAGSAAIMFVVLYMAHGISIRTSTALAGTLVGILITACTGIIAVKSARLSGVTDESGAILSSFAGHVSFQGLLTCTIIVAGLGVLNDVTITQASAVWELRAAAANMTRPQLFASSMRIGRDHIASTIYTIMFAYTGTALTVLLLFFVYERPLIELLSTEDIAEEVTRTLASAIGLVLAVPITTLIAVGLVAPRPLGTANPLTGNDSR